MISHFIVCLALAAPSTRFHILMVIYCCLPKKKKKKMVIYCYCILTDWHCFFFQFSGSTFFGRSSGSLRRGAVSGSREGDDSDPARARTPEASPGTLHKISGGKRPLPLVGSSDPKHSSGKNNPTSKNLESTLKGIESLHFDDEERVHYWILLV